MAPEPIPHSQSPLSIYPYEVGVGHVAPEPEATLLHLARSDGEHYSDAQIDDYHDDGYLRWRAPVRMSLRARFSDGEAKLRGTAGFGFWNDPFGMTREERQGKQIPRFRFPKAVWFFFASPPSDMALAMGVPGSGWKAATIDASSVMAKALLPLAPFGMIACRWTWSYRWLWPLAQGVLKIDEALLATAMDEVHDYRLEWGTERISFSIDEVELFCSKHSPRGPLGFVAWIDNQFMVATPRGEVRHGVMATNEQWLEISALEIEEG